MANAPTEGSWRTFRRSQTTSATSRSRSCTSHCSKRSLGLSVDQIDALQTSGQDAFSAGKSSLLKTVPPLCAAEPDGFDDYG